MTMKKKTLAERARESAHIHEPMVRDEYAHVRGWLRGYRAARRDAAKTLSGLLAGIDARDRRECGR